MLEGTELFLFDGIQKRILMENIIQKISASGLCSGWDHIHLEIFLVLSFFIDCTADSDLPIDEKFT